jgi:hypothetical protein
MHRVAQSEHDLVTVARALVGQGGFAAIEPFVASARALPETIGPVAMELLRETLGRGVVLALARRGGWRKATYLGPEGAGLRQGRLWERHAAPALCFSGFSLALCRWIARGGPSILRGQDLLVPPEGLRLGDELVLYLALDLLAAGGIATRLAEQPAASASALAQLGFAELFAEVGAPSLPRASDAWRRICVGEGAILLEALEPDLARRWLEMERGKPGLCEPQAMIRLGTAQEAVLDGFLDAAEAVGRRDLAFFLLDAGRTLLSSGPEPSAWVSRLRGTSSLAERQAARHAAGALLRALSRWQGWNEAHRGVRFIHEGYEGAQMMLRRFERFGSRCAENARGVLRGLESLDALAGAGDA